RFSLFSFPTTAASASYTLSLHDALPILDGLRLALEAGKLPLDVRDQHVGHVVRESSPHDDAQRREVSAVLGKRVGRNLPAALAQDRKSTRLNSSHDQISYAAFCLKKKK